jgi:hypothetical protein
LVASLLVLGISAICCDPGYPDRLGLELAPSGSVILHYAKCKREVLVTRVHLSRYDPYTPVWEIRSDNPKGEPLLKYVVGEEPQGFHTIVPLTQPLPAGAFQLGVDSSELKDRRESFRLSTLRPGWVVTDGGDYFAPEKFVEGAMC